jgi:hypothetical protein
MSLAICNIQLSGCFACLLLAQVHVYTINPLALSNDELYGSFEEATHEWQDGVLARIMRGACKDESPDQKWILFDGPVDTMWIESMNTTLDDNKLLTLLSGGWLCSPTQLFVGSTHVAMGYWLGHSDLCLPCTLVLGLARDAM